MDEREPRAWEYLTLRPPREPTMKEAKDPAAELNDLGSDGWELADTIDYVGGGTKLLVLKRPAPGAADREAGTDGGRERVAGGGRGRDGGMDGVDEVDERTGGGP